MGITLVGPWVLLVVGALTLLAAIWLWIKRTTVKSAIWSSVFGMALAGVGVFGPDFLDPYGDFLQKVFNAMGSPSETTYAEVVDQIASKDVPPEMRELGLSYMMDNPIEGMDSLFAAGAEKTRNLDAKNALSSARETLEARSLAAAAVLSPRPPMLRPDSARPEIRLNDAVRKELAKPLLAQPDSVLRRYNIPRETLRRDVSRPGGP